MLQSPLWDDYELKPLRGSINQEPLRGMKVALCTWGFPEFTASLARALRAFCDPIVILPEDARGAAVTGAVWLVVKLTKAAVRLFRKQTDLCGIIIAMFGPQTWHLA